jgi:hypothetical protein
VYHSHVNENAVPDFVVDITGFTEKKIASILAYVLNFMIQNRKNLSHHFRQNSRKFELSIKGLRRLVGVEHAEGFTVERYFKGSNRFEVKLLIFFQKNI